MRVLLAHPFLFETVHRGSERYVDDLVDHLSAQGHTVEVLAASRTADRTRTYRGVPCHEVVTPDHPVPQVEAFGEAALPWLRRNAGRFDVMQAMLPAPTLAAVEVGLPVVFSVCNYPTAEWLARNPVQRQLIGDAVLRADAVRALSGAAADAVGAAYGRRPGVLPPGVFVDRFPLERRPRTGDPTVLFVGALDERRKRLDAVASAVARLPSARFEVSGQGRYDWALDPFPELAPRTTMLGVGDAVHLPTHYAAAAVTALPSRDEAFGLVVVESLACGTPVLVAAGSGGPEETVDARPIGAVSADEDLLPALEQAIALAADPATPDRCRERAADFDWSVLGPRHLVVYEEAIDSATRAA